MHSLYDLSLFSARCAHYHGFCQFISYTLFPYLVVDTLRLATGCNWTVLLIYFAKLIWHGSASKSLCRGSLIETTYTFFTLVSLTSYSHNIDANAMIKIT